MTELPFTDDVCDHGTPRGGRQLRPKGVLGPAGAVATDANTVTFTSSGADAIFPYPSGLQRRDADHVEGVRRRHAPSTRSRPAPAPGKAVTYNQETGATFERRPRLVGAARCCSTASNSSSSTRTGPMVTATGRPRRRHRPVRRAVRRRPVDDPNFAIIATEAALPSRSGCARTRAQFHGQAGAPGARATRFDRPALDALSCSRARRRIRQRPRHLGGLPVLRPVRPAAGQEIAQGEAAARSDANVRQPDPDPARGRQLLEIPDPRRCSRARPAGRDHPRTWRWRSLDTFYGAQWCPADPSGPAVLRRRRARHRRLRPSRHPGRLPQRGPQEQGIWNSSQYSSSAFDAAFKSSRPPSAWTPRRRPAPRSKTILNEDAAIGLPYFYNYLAGNSKKFNGVYACALGQMVFSAASKASRHRRATVGPSIGLTSFLPSRAR